MQIDGAIVKEQGVTFAIVVVKENVLRGVRSSIEETRDSFRTIFPGVPIILMAQNARGVPTYDGRPDIVKFLAKIHPSRIPWKRYTVQ